MRMVRRRRMRNCLLVRIRESICPAIGILDLRLRDDRDEKGEKSGGTKN